MTAAASNTDRAVAALRAQIISGDLAPGSDHLETELAEGLGMSRTPVREACRTLAAHGLLDVRPRRGVRIRPISPRDMAEIYDVLTELESLAASYAASKGYSDRELAVLSASILDMETAVERADRLAWANSDDLFHAELVRLGGNSRIIDIVARMVDQVRRARMVTLYIRALPTRSTGDHRAVYEAIRAGHAATARALHHAHRRNAKDTMIALLERHHLTSL